MHFLNDYEKRVAFSEIFPITILQPINRTGRLADCPNPKKHMSDINVAEFKTHEKDTGSADFQVANLTDRILDLTEHMKKNKKDSASKRGLLKMVAQRRKLLVYIKNKDEGRYAKLIKGLGLRR